MLDSVIIGGSLRVRMWRFKFPAFRKPLPQYSQVYVLAPQAPLDGIDVDSSWLCG